MEYNELIKLIPKDKFDNNSICKLSELSEDEIKPILPELLFWMADMNWPIAKGIIRVITKFPNSLLPLIKERLKPTEKDEDWKYFIISDLIPQLPVDSQKLLIEDILRIINNPTDGEKISEVCYVATRYTNNYQQIRGARNMDIKNMSIEEIENFFKNSDLSLIENSIKELIKIFLADVRPKDRNQIALMLSDYGGNLAVEPIIEMLKRPATKRNRGTLLYALEELDCHAHLDFLFSLMLEGNFEVSRESYLIIEKILPEENNDLEFIKKQIPLLTEKIRALQNDIDFYVSILELLSK